jgi:hypothetical protein
MKKFRVLHGFRVNGFSAEENDIIVVDESTIGLVIFYADSTNGIEFEVRTANGNFSNTDSLENLYTRVASGDLEVVV